jgi:hypothetical protein
MRPELTICLTGPASIDDPWRFGVIGHDGKILTEGTTPTIRALDVFLPSLESLADQERERINKS